ncbi:S9 family peptidase [Actinomadura luteofluorescens]|uniref:S9 family peptidase n=1 Tax=Actinomadura luteofluorescens TaxID=46163 RepID=UPI0021644AD3|nr:S9 family peptidase [Actinomadura glauciflava]MCR3740477.1 Dipeptidyl aminopeptidase/acylaminoacyl peptidase [Actinomadura glauciflava]
MTGHPGMLPRHIAEMPTVAQPAVSPDGRWVLVVLQRADEQANRYRSGLWLVAADGTTPPRPFSDGEHSDMNPCWSPQGDRVAFLRAEDGGQSVLVVPFGVDESAVTVAAGLDGAGALSFSPDGARLAFTARVRPARCGVPDSGRPPSRVTRLRSRLDDVGFIADRPRHVFVVDADGSAAPRDLTPGECEFEDPAWDRDARSLVFTGATHDDRDLDLRRDLYAVDVADGRAPRRIGAPEGVFALPSVSPDGRRIAFLGTDDHETAPRNSHVAVLSRETGRHRWVSSEIDRSFAPASGARSPVWLDDDEILVTVEDRGDVHLYRLSAERRSPARAVWSGQGVVTAYDAAAGSTAFVLSTATRPSELHVVRDGVGRRVTDFGARFTAEVRPRSPAPLTVPSRDGTVEIDAWMLTPPGFRSDGSHPVLLNIHGGPFNQYGTGFHEDFQIQAAAGYVVVWCNPRGGSGREERFARAITGPAFGGTGWGSVDHDDVISVLDHVLEGRPGLDRDRVGVLGGSYGGYLTNWAIGQSDRFAAACSERGGSNLATAEWASDGAGTFRHTFGASHLDDPRLYRAMSPIAHVQKITTPLLILHSDQDLRTPPAMADELFVALRLLRRDVEMVRFPGEGHELSRSGSPVHRRQRMEILLDFFGRRLRPAHEV